MVKKLVDLLAINQVIVIYLEMESFIVFDKIVPKLTLLNIAIFIAVSTILTSCLFSPSKPESSVPPPVSTEPVTPSSPDISAEVQNTPSPTSTVEVQNTSVECDIICQQKKVKAAAAIICASNPELPNCAKLGTSEDPTNDLAQIRAIQKQQCANHQSPSDTLYADCKKQGY